MFLDAAPGSRPIAPRAGYQLMLGGFSTAVLVFGVWWTPLVDWTQRSLQLLR